MALWKLGVGVDINNNSFKFGTRVYAELSADLISGTSLSYTNDTGSAIGRGDGLVAYLNVGDKILVGPSTYSGYEGLTQVLTLTSVGSSSMSFSETLSVKFSSGDAISAMGTRCPGGWDPDTTTNIMIYRLFDSDNNGLDTRGYKDRYRLQFKNISQFEQGISFALDSDEFIPNVKHRAGFYYQYLPTTADDGVLQCIIRSEGNDPWGGSALTATGVSTSDWALFTGTVDSPSSLGNFWYFKVSIAGLTSGVTGWANIDDVFLEHAKDTDDESAGVYTFDDYPAFGSRKYSYTSGVSITRLKNQSLVINTQKGSDRTAKLIINASFKDVSRSLRDNLAVLQEWQYRGFYLVLHHDIPFIHNNLYGYLTIKDTSLTHWSSNYCSFNITFEER